MKLRTLLILSTAALVATLTVAAPASASEIPAVPSDNWESAILLEAGTGKVLGRWVPAQSESVVELEVKTGRILQAIECNEWQDARTPQACAGHVVSKAPYRPAQLAGLLGLL